MVYPESEIAPHAYLLTPGASQPLRSKKLFPSGGSIQTLKGDSLQNIHQWWPAGY